MSEFVTGLILERLLASKNARYKKAQSTWHIVHGTRYTVHATRYILNGTWYTVHDKQYMLNDTWYALHGTRYMVHGVWYKIHDIQYKVHGERYELQCIRYNVQYIKAKLNLNPDGIKFSLREEIYFEPNISHETA